MSGKERVGSKGAAISLSEKSVRSTILRVSFYAEYIFAIDWEELRDGLGCKLFHSMAHSLGIPLKKGIRVNNSGGYKPFSCAVVHSGAWPIVGELISLAILSFYPF